MDDTKTEMRGQTAEAVNDDRGARSRFDKSGSDREGSAVSRQDAGTEAKAVQEMATEPVIVSSLPPEEIDRLTADIVAALKTVYDPEIPADIYELGLIYKVDFDDDRNVTIDMTLTAPGCPVAGEMPGWVEAAVSTVQGVNAVSVNMTFDPPWDQSRMSDEARLALNMF